MSRLFIKSIATQQAHILTAEADGLAALAASHTVAVPQVVGCHDDGHITLLALEWLDLHTQPHGAYGRRLGQALAALHRAPPPQGAGRFGWHRSNMLGGTVQRNRWSQHTGLSGWLAFFAQERLGAMREQLAAGRADPALLTAIDRVLECLPTLFDDGYVPRASLIHGDLWSGNWGCLADGKPVVFDPAVSVSDKEADLAMMELFGTPPAGFWEAYREAAGLAPGYARRRKLYQLYHLLNHELLFGGYARSALAAAQQVG